MVLPPRDLPTDHWLRFSAEQRAELQGLPDVTLLSSAGDTRSVNLSVLCSYYRDCDDAFHHVHPELAELVRASGAASGRLCSLCGAASKKPSATPPRTSLAAGCDYGLFSRMGLVKAPQCFRGFGLSRCAHLFADGEGARPWSVVCSSHLTARPHDRVCARGTLHRLPSLR